MVLYETTCGCVFEPCGAVTFPDGRVNAACGCKFYPCDNTCEGDHASIDIQTNAAPISSDQTSTTASELQQQDADHHVKAFEDRLNDDKLTALIKDMKSTISACYSSLDGLEQVLKLGDPCQYLNRELDSLSTTSFVQEHPCFAASKVSVEEECVIEKPRLTFSMLMKKIQGMYAPAVTDIQCFKAGFGPRRYDRRLAIQDRRMRIDRQEYHDTPRRHRAGRPNGRRQQQRPSHAHGNANAHRQNDSNAPQPQGNSQSRHEAELESDTNGQPPRGPESSNWSGDAVDGSQDSNEDPDADGSSSEH